MAKELKSIFKHCYGFEGVTTAEHFFQYVKKCQLETTMPFNDYWAVTPNLSDFAFTRYLLPAGFALLIAVGAPFVGLGWVSIAALMVLGAIVLVAWRSFTDKHTLRFRHHPLLRRGRICRQCSRRSTCSGVSPNWQLGSQGKSDEELYSEFGAFITKYRPDTVRTPTQRRA